jgi:manganese transport protein
MALLVAAAALYSRGAPAPVSVEIADVFWRLLHTSGVLAGGVFLAGLLASGLSSSVVGTLAGQVVMQGFVGFRTPLWLRRAVTMIPGFLIVAFCTDATHALVLSQVVLSLTLPVPLIALIVITSRREIMGPFVSGKAMRATAAFAAAIIVALNVALLLQVTCKVN